MACNDTCRRCGFAGSDLQLVGCGCFLHARCTPLAFVIAGGEQEYCGMPDPVTSKNIPCPFCQRGVINGIKLLALSFESLERAVDLRKQSAVATVKASSAKKRSRQDDEEEAAFRQIEAESSFLLLSHTNLNGNSDRHNHRTGRWSLEEVAFCDYVVTAFDQGTLPIPHGVKLNDLLGDLLLCKSSRLTKKMKNAKLSTRSYTFQAPLRTMDGLCCATFSSLQHGFLDSVPSEPSRLELAFNMTKLWRTHFSNLCLQVGYEFLDARDWVASLEEMEQKASEAEDHIRKARRRRMSLALRTDVGEAANPGVFIGGVPARDANMVPPSVTSQPTASSLEETEMKRHASQVTISDTERQDEDDDFLAALEMTAAGEGPIRSRLASADMDFGLGIDEFMDPMAIIPDLNDCPESHGNCGPFLEEVVSYMESKQVPFQHVDVWVPSYMGDDGKASVGNDPAKLRLFPAGSATRSDIDATLREQLNEYGVYSTNFSFAPGHGLPGRVYTSGQASWESRIHETDPSIFERAGGAKVYGVKTAVGVPLVAEGIGRIVVAMYSISDLSEDKAMLNQFTEDFKAWNPEPKWKLVIDLGPTPKPSKQNAATVPSRMVHYRHLKQSPDLKPAPVVSTSSGSSFMAGSTAMAPAGMPAAPVTSATMAAAAVMARATTPVMSAPVAKSAPSESPTANVGDEDDIATLLGEHMPMADSTSTTLLPHFMSLRLLLLRSPERRSQQEMEKLEILKRSYKGYTKDNKRSGSELAALLAKDWMYLQPNVKSEPETTFPSPPLFVQNKAMPAAGPALTATLPSPMLSYQLPPPAWHPTAPGMVVNQHGTEKPTNFAAPSSFQSTKPLEAPSRSRSVSASSDSPPYAATVVPDS